MPESTLCIYVDRHKNLYMCMDEYRETCMYMWMDGWIWAELYESVWK